MEIKLENIKYKKILNNLNINFKNKKINVLIGSNDIEKTAILELIASLIKPDEGNVATISKKQIGLSFKFPEEQFFNTTVLKEIKFNTKNSYDLNKFGLDEKILTQDPFTLSTGEMRKLSLLISMINNPKVLLLDNPTTNLDIESKKNIIEIIKELKNENITVIISTCDIEFAQKVSDILYVINKECITYGTKEEIFKNKKLLEENKIELPKTIEFSDYVYQNLKIKFPYRENVNDIIKDIYRYARN